MVWANDASLNFRRKIAENKLKRTPEMLFYHRKNGRTLNCTTLKIDLQTDKLSNMAAK